MSLTVLANPLPMESLRIASFKAFSQFNKRLPASVVASHYGLDLRLADRFFAGDSLHCKIVRSLAEDVSLPIKEVVESFEVFQVVRRDLRSPIIADLCCGHGLVGMLLAVFERRIEAVHLCDARFPQSSAKCLQAIEKVAPWIQGRVHHHAGKLKDVGGEVPFTSALATHACGNLTDKCLELAIERRCPIAVTPCCYSRRTSLAPPVLVRELGLETASDAARTCRLEGEGYLVKWKYIPEVISPMNRVIVAIAS